MVRLKRTVKNRVSIGIILFCCLIAIAIPVYKIFEYQCRYLRVHQDISGFYSGYPDEKFFVTDKLYTKKNAAHNFSTMGMVIDHNSLAIRYILSLHEADKSQCSAEHDCNWRVSSDVLDLVNLTSGDHRGWRNNDRVNASVEFETSNIDIEISSLSDDELGYIQTFSFSQDSECSFLANNHPAIKDGDYLYAEIDDKIYRFGLKYIPGLREKYRPVDYGYVNNGNIYSAFGVVNWDNGYLNKDKTVIVPGMVPMEELVDMVYKNPFESLLNIILLAYGVVILMISLVLIRIRR